jgi:glucose-1-phosphate cytidylyltransferase
MNKMQAVILAGGLGTRMREESEFRPKPLVQIGERPILEHIIFTLAEQGVTNFLILLGYKGTQIRDHFLKFREHTVTTKIDLKSGEVNYLEDSLFPKCEITFMNTGKDSLTGERLLRASRYLENEFILTYGDGIANVNVADLIKCHNASYCPVTVTVTQNPSKFGVVKRDKAGKVTSFSEKPEGHDLINMGYFMVKKESLTLIPRNTMLEVEFMRNLIEMEKLNSYKHEGFFAAIDTPRDLDTVNGLYKEGALPWLI